MHGEAPRQIVLRSLFDIPKNPHSLAWEPFRPGVKIHRLYGNQAEGPSAALLWYEPGAGVPLHEHMGYEHLLVLASTQTDNGIARDFGTLVINPPGSAHAVTVPNGGIVLAIWEKPVKFKAP